jgi:hypothetical protein
MIVKWFGVLATVVILNPPPATAQGLVGAATQAKDLTFPTVPSTVSANAPRMTLLKPNGSGPFPAIVLHHQCAGLRPEGSPNRSMATWAQAAVPLARSCLPSYRFPARPFLGKAVNALTFDAFSEMIANLVPWHSDYDSLDVMG